MLLTHVMIVINFILNPYWSHTWPMKG